MSLAVEPTGIDSDGGSDPQPPYACFPSVFSVELGAFACFHIQKHYYNKMMPQLRLSRIAV
jgi:hypothetical protein